MVSSTSSSVAYTVVAADDGASDLGNLSTNDLKNALEKGDVEVKLSVLRFIIISTLNGTSYVSVDWIGLAMAYFADLVSSYEHAPACLLDRWMDEQPSNRMECS
jgi:hypothetical protein